MIEFNDLLTILLDLKYSKFIKKNPILVLMQNVINIQILITNINQTHYIAKLIS